MNPFKRTFSPRTARHATYFRLGKPGPGIREVWVCLHGHGQPVSELAVRLVHFQAPGRLLIFPAGLAPDPATPNHPLWYRPDSLGPDLALVRAFLDELATDALVACPAGVALTVLGYGEGATAATAWLAGNRFPYDQLILDAAAFPAAIVRDLLFADLPRSPVLLVSQPSALPLTTALEKELQAAGQPTHLSVVEHGPLLPAVLQIKQKR